MGFRQWILARQQKTPLWLVNAVGIVVLVLFALAFARAIRLSLSTPPQPHLFPVILAYILTTVNGMLAANLGAFVGVSVATVVWNRTEPPSSPFQIVAAVAYALIVLVAWVVWWKAGFAEAPDVIVTAIPEMCRTGLGIVLGVFALALGVQRP